MIPKKIKKSFEKLDKRVVCYDHILGGGAFNKVGVSLGTPVHHNNAKHVI